MLGTAFRNARVVGGIVGFGFAAAVVVVGLAELAFLIAVFPLYASRGRRGRVWSAFFAATAVQSFVLLGTALVRVSVFIPLASSRGTSFLRFWGVQDWLFVCGGLLGSIALTVVAARLRRKSVARAL